MSMLQSLHDQAEDAIEKAETIGDERFGTFWQPWLSSDADEVGF